MVAGQLCCAHACVGLPGSPAPGAGTRHPAPGWCAAGCCSCLRAWPALGLWGAQHSHRGSAVVPPLCTAGERHSTRLGGCWACGPATRGRRSGSPCPPAWGPAPTLVEPILFPLPRALLRTFACVHMLVVVRLFVCGCFKRLGLDSASSLRLPATLCAEALMPYAACTAWLKLAPHDAIQVLGAGQLPLVHVALVPLLGHGWSRVGWARSASAARACLSAPGALVSRTAPCEAALAGACCGWRPGARCRTSAACSP